VQSNTSTKTINKDLIFQANMSFSIDDIQSKKEWRERAYAEAKLIYSKPNTRRGRSLTRINEDCLYGHAAEQYLIETGWDDDERPYKDLFDPELDPIDVKCTEHKGNIPYVLDRCKKKKLKTWIGFPDIVYLFINNRKSKEYLHEGIYYWNENRQSFRKLHNPAQPPRKTVTNISQ